MANVAVIGTGAWGTTLARLIAAAPQTMEANETVNLWEHHADRAQEMEQARENTAYLPDFPFPPNLHVSSDLAEAVENSLIVVLAPPAQQVRAHARLLAPLLSPGVIVICASKGLELDTHLRMSEVLAEELPADMAIGVLSGPNLAAEVARGLPAAAVVALADQTAAEIAQAALNTPLFRVYTSDDVVGVELGGALKNIIAIGIGVNDGLGYGDNAKASFMTRGLAEISRLALAAGANPLTLAGLAGLGDLIATCSSPLSRNRSLGLALAKGQTLTEALAGRRTVVEGVTTTRAALQLAANLGVELPITQQIAHVLFDGRDVRTAVAALLTRDLKGELEGLDEG